MTEKFEHFIGSVAEDHVLWRDTELLCNCFTQVKPAAIGIQMRVVQRGAHRLYRLGRRPQRILVRRQFNDCTRIDAEFARSFLDRLSRFVHCNVSQLRICQLPNGSHARQNKQAQRKFPTHSFLLILRLRLLVITLSLKSYPQDHVQE